MTENIKKLLAEAQTQNAVLRRIATGVEALAPPAVAVVDGARLPELTARVISEGSAEWKLEPK